ncbi:MAG: tetratricopeptide repeat protein [Candidatus Glassbacteria bacterium]|nr:tetratricopeptide repeat protein [Candidatus Glassbacteria bacterium]
MTVFPGRLLVMLVFFILLSRPAQAGWPKILVLPPESETEIDRKVKEEFQWDLTDVLDKCRYFESVTQKEYENYLQEHNMTGVKAIPDSVLPQMMEDLQSIIFARSTISQPGGTGTEFSAQVTYIYPKDHYTKDDYTIESKWYSVESEKKSWNLAGEFVDVVFAARKLIITMSIARPYYNNKIYDKVWKLFPARKNMNKALKNYRKLVAMEPENRTFNFMVAMSLMKLKRYAEAVARFNEILTNIDPSHVPTHEILANHYYYTSNDYEGALRHFSKLAEIDPERYTYTHYWATSLTRLERQDEAIEVYEKLIGIRDEDADVRHLMADYYYNKAGELEAACKSDTSGPLDRKALDYMTRGCEISNSAGNPSDPSWIESHCQRLNFLATLQHELNDTGKEIETLRRIAELDSAFPGACYNLGIYAHLAGKFDEAIDYYEKAVNCAEDAQKAALNFQIGVINLQKIKDYPRAVTALTAALETNDIYMNEMAHYFRATAYLEYARELDYASDEVADIDALIGFGIMNHARVDRALSYYAKAMADLREISTNDPKMVRSTQRHVNKITTMRERLAGIKRQIDYNRKNR